MSKFSSVNYSALPSSPYQTEDENSRNTPPWHSLRSRSFRIFKYIFPFVIILSTATYLVLSYAQWHPNSTASDSIELADSAWTKETFIQSVIDTDIDGPFNNTALSSLCSSKNWTPGLIVKCEAPAGGIGNVRNVLLNCIRYAIEAGGLSSVPSKPSCLLTTYSNLFHRP